MVGKLPSPRLSATAVVTVPRDPRLTEQRNPRTADLDLASPAEIVARLGDEDATVAGAVREQAAAITQALEAIERAFRAGGRLLYVGAGTSGRLGVLDAAECPPTFGTDPRMVVGIIAGGRDALVQAQEGAEDRPEDGAADVDAHAVAATDVVAGIAASGTTPYVRGALARARAVGATTVLVACSPPPPEMAAVTDIAIVVRTGPEAVTGSTRLKAGTATKLVLNTLTTGAMIRVGKTWGNLMVDLRATNAKLKDRSERIVAEVLGTDRDTAQAWLAKADGGVKLALAMALGGWSRDDAERHLATAGGVVRRALPHAAPPPVPDAAAPEASP
jgi:N-acetylmuramic acid 6-phosphate etherase